MWNTLTILQLRKFNKIQALTHMKINKFNSQNIFWLASYPKSGNTMLRLFLSLYFFSEDGTLNDFNVIKNINNLNNYKIYKKLTDIPPLDNFVSNPEIISNYWLRAQKRIKEQHPK